MPKTVIYTGRFDRYRVDVPNQARKKPDRHYFPKGKPVEVPDEVAAKVLDRDDFVEAPADDQAAQTPAPDTSTSSRSRNTGRSAASGSNDKENS